MLGLGRPSNVPRWRNRNEEQAATPKSVSAITEQINGNSSLDPLPKGRGIEGGTHRWPVTIMMSKAMRTDAKRHKPDEVVLRESTDLADSGAWSWRS